MTLAELLDGLAAEGEDYRITAPESWLQGRTLYGGLSAALALRVAKRATPGLAPLRSVQMAFIGPAAGELHLRPGLLRQGRSAATVGVDAFSGDGLAFRAVLTFGAARESEVVHERLPMPPAPAPESCPPFERSTLSHAFIDNFDVLHAGGSLPVTVGSEPELLLWIRLREKAGVAADEALLATADTLPPAAIVAFSKPAPISTMSWMIDLAPGTVAPGWRLLRSESDAAGQGYSGQAMACWSRDGRRLASGRQLVALFA